MGRYLCEDDPAVLEAMPPDAWLLEIVAPVLLALVLTDMALGMVSRAVPQMNVFFVGIPAKILVAFAAAAASLPFVAGRLDIGLDEAMMRALGVLGR